MADPVEIKDAGSNITAQVTARGLEVTDVEQTGTPTVTKITNSGSELVFVANSSMKGRYVYNEGTVAYYLSLSNPATAANAFVRIDPKQLCKISKFTDAIYGIQQSGTPDIRAMEVV